MYIIYYRMLLKRRRGCTLFVHHHHLSDFIGTIKRQAERCKSKFYESCELRRIFPYEVENSSPTATLQSAD